MYMGVQLYHYFVSQFSEFCRHNPLCCFSTCVCCLFRYDSVRKLLDTTSYIETFYSFNVLQYRLSRCEIGSTDSVLCN